jgi:GDP/UDP-N,N'-diacetylbacillosamine 2-epimerase (hydrolysing)
MRKICIITGSRADYYLLKWIMQSIKEDRELELQVIATGMHLSPEFDSTYKIIEQDGFQINRKVEMLMSSDTSVGIAKSMGIGMIAFSDALNELKPDLILVLGDRFEIFSAVSAALIACIPVAHLHGGEITQGAFDDAIRHSLTKMSHLHFVASETYFNRVIQLGEQPDNVFLVGGLGVDCIKRMELLNRVQLEDSIEFKFLNKNLLITFHPVTLQGDLAEKQMKELLVALEALKDTGFIFTLPNADTNGRSLIKLVQDFVSNNSNARLYKSLGQLRYLSCAAQVDGVIGNSSSGLLEVPSLKKGTINIGLRQQGRLQATSVINCEPNSDSISRALLKLYSKEFQNNLLNSINPYGDGGASEKIVDIIKNYPLDNLIKKVFYDLPLKSEHRI